MNDNRYALLVDNSGKLQIMVSYYPDALNKFLEKEKIPKSGILGRKRFNDSRTLPSILEGFSREIFEITNEPERQGSMHTNMLVEYPNTMERELA